MSKSVRKRQHVVKQPSATPQRSSAGDAFALLAINVLQLAGHLTAAGDALTKPLGQTSARWQVLAVAGHGRMSVADIARTLGITRQGVQRIADLLEAEGLARYEDNPDHLRAKHLVLTARGRELLAAIRAKQSVWANALGADIGEGDLRLAGLILERVLAALKTPAAGNA